MVVSRRTLADGDGRGTLKGDSDVVDEGGNEGPWTYDDRREDVK